MCWTAAPARVVMCSKTATLTAMNMMGCSTTEIGDSMRFMGYKSGNTLPGNLVVQVYDNSRLLHYLSVAMREAKSLHAGLSFVDRMPKK